MNKSIILLLLMSSCSLYAPEPPSIPFTQQDKPATSEINNSFNNRVQKEKKLHFVKKYIIYQCISCSNDQSIIPESRKIEFWFYAQNADRALIEGKELQVNSLYQKLRKIGSTARIYRKYTNNQFTTITFYKNK